MIKQFEEFINEDYFSKLANRKDTGIVRKENEVTEELVRSCMHSDKKHQNRTKSITIRKESGRYVVDIDGDFYLNSYVEEIPFQFGKVTGNFNASWAGNLTSLNGCPKEVGYDFIVYSDELKSLEGAPEKVGGNFSCRSCSGLTSLVGCPKEVGGFSCERCSNLTSLEGAPEKVGGSFECHYCTKLTSLNGCPKEVGNAFDCSHCGGKFTKEEVKSLCNVKRNIFV